MTQDGTVESVLRDQILNREQRRRGNDDSPVQLTTSWIGNHNIEVDAKSAKLQVMV